VVSPHYLDSSVAAHILDGRREAATWFEGAVEDDEVMLISSRILRLELTRFLRRDGRPLSLRDAILNRVNSVPLTERVVQRAEGIESHVKSLDAIHLASALETGIEPTVVTHDARMKQVAEILGLATFDPLAA